MPKPLPEYTNPEINLPSKDPFYRTNRIFNNIFDKNMVLKEAMISCTNVVGFINVNFNQVVIRKVADTFDGNSESLLTCGHTVMARHNAEAYGRKQEMTCYRCGFQRAYRNFEHEWSHIIFKSSPALFEQFVTMYSAHFGVRVSELIRLIVHAFDDLRVQSLWTLVYPGSAHDIYQNWKDAAEQDVELNHNFITWIFGVALDAENLSNKSGPFHDLIPIAKKAAQEVRGRGAANMLMTVRWFLEQCLDRLINPEDEEQEEGQENEEESGDADKDNDAAPPETRDEAAQQISDKTTHDFRREQQHYSLSQHDKTINPLFKLQKSDEAALAKIFNTQMLEKEVPTLQQQGPKTPIDIDMEGAIKALKKASDEEMPVNQFLLTDASAKVLLAEVEPKHISPNSRIVIPSAEEDQIDRMRSVFAKYIGKKITKLIDDGDEIDVQALIQYRMDGQDDSIFEDDGLTRGFAYLTLCDMSQSMEGTPFQYVCIGSEMLKRALDYPFVRGHLWGFRGAIGKGADNYKTISEKMQALTNGGEVWIYKYHRDCDGYLAPAVEAISATGFKTNIPVLCDGMTPTHTGVHVAAKYLAAKTPPGMEKRMFILTDGNPTQFKNNGHDLPREALLRFVRKEIDNARANRIKVFTIILGDEINDHDAAEMFGHQTMWRRVPAMNIGSALLDVVIREFVRFLRH